MEITTVVVSPLGANCYIIYPDIGSKALIIDAGGDFDKISDKLSEKKFTPGAVLLTHGHFDHSGACAAFQEAGAKIYITGEDEKLIVGDGNLARYFGYKFRRFIPDNRLIAGFIELFGIKIDIISTPGHTAGGVTFKIGGALFTGDTIMRASYGRCDLPSGDQNLLTKSAEKLFSLDGDYTVYPGHGEITSLAYEREFNPVTELFRR